MKYSRHLSFLILISLFTSASAEIFKWVDENGKVHYGDRPVKNSKAVEVDDSNLSGEMTSDEERANKRQRLLDAFDEDRKKKDEEMAKQQKRAEKNKRKCLRAKDQMKSYERASRLYRLDGEGNRVILSDKQREKSTQRLKAQIAKYCK